MWGRTARIALGCLVLALVVGPAISQTPPAETALPVAPPPQRPLTTPRIDRDDAVQLGCDGFGQMLPSGDGLTVATANIWRVGGNRIRREPDMYFGITYCDRALAIQAEQYPRFWQRRVSFLQARALHNIKALRLDAAAADIAAADAAAVEPDVFHMRSLRANTRFIEAYLLIERGDRAAGEAMALRTWRERPYNRQSVSLALAAIGPQGTPATIETLLYGLGQIDPNSAYLPYIFAFETGDFDKAIALSGEIVRRRPLPPSSHDTRTQIYHVENQRYLDIGFWVEVLGRKAYALAAKGQGDAANAILADLDQRLAAATTAPTPLGERPTDQARTRAAVQEQVNLQISSAIPTRLAAWRTLVLTRIDIAAGHPPPLNTERMAAITTLRSSYASVELPAAASRRTPTAYTTAALYESLSLPKHDPPTMFSWLLDGETAQRAQRVVAAGEWFASREQREHGDCEETQAALHAQVCDWAAESTMAISEERALLRAARFAIAQNQPALVIAERRDSQHSTVSTMYGTPINEAQTGFSTVLTIDARAASTPDASCWRCLDAAAIEASFKDLYVAPARSSRSR